jgi:hypothetical protein
VRKQAFVPRLWRSGTLGDGVPALPGWADVWLAGPKGLGLIAPRSRW